MKDFSHLYGNKLYNPESLLFASSVEYEGGVAAFIYIDELDDIDEDLEEFGDQCLLEGWRAMKSVGNHYLVRDDSTTVGAFAMLAVEDGLSLVVAPSYAGCMDSLYKAVRKYLQMLSQYHEVMSSSIRFTISPAVSDGEYGKICTSFCDKLCQTYGYRYGEDKKVAVGYKHSTPVTDEISRFIASRIRGVYFEEMGCPVSVDVVSMCTTDMNELLKTDFGTKQLKKEVENALKEQYGV